MLRISGSLFVRGASGHNWRNTSFTPVAGCGYTLGEASRAKLINQSGSLGGTSISRLDLARLIANFAHHRFLSRLIGFVDLEPEMWRQRYAVMPTRSHEQRDQTALESFHS